MNTTTATINGHIFNVTRREVSATRVNITATWAKDGRPVMDYNERGQVFDVETDADAPLVEVFQWANIWN